MTDCILFASLFSVFLVLHYPRTIGPALSPLINLSCILIETFFLLLSNFTYFLATLEIGTNRMTTAIFWLAITFILGIGFVFMELREFIYLHSKGYFWNVSGSASAFFTLVGTHGVHVIVGLLWILIMIIQLPILKINQDTKRRIVYLGLFWNFLDIVWIFLFTTVYLMEVIM
ncbi:cytochrome o ubiquinol oxidase subunit III [Coxiella endosymbiont of Amblyomma sculptum]|nr:cytochrome o ubiquinol oxidase subunit III [Coxiella endosymbiont of Amblyomma sculptum]